MPKYKVHNIMEDLVDELLEPSMQKAGGCMCEKCRSDVMALALNRLPAKYCAVWGNQILVKAEYKLRQNRADVLTAVTSAAAIVSASPQHENS